MNKTTRMNRALKVVPTAMFVGVLGLLTSCVANRAYRDRDSRPWKPESEQQAFVQGEQMDQYEPVKTDHPFDLAFIEFDEKGDYWDRRQLGWTVQEIKNVARNDDLVLVVYVHGWQNNASDLRGHDVGKFRCLLQHLALADNGGHRFFGVYLSWRGKSVPGGDGWFKDRSLPDIISKAIFFVPHELSFFGRKNAATRVAGMPITEAIFQSVGAARSATRLSGHGSKTILVGHSFGALVAEKAMAQALAALVVSSSAGNSASSFIAPVDFVVLLNSAGESIYAKEMIDLLRRRQLAQSKGLHPNQINAQQPLIVSITSTADAATGVLFPIGTSLSNMFGLFRKYEWDARYGESSHNVSQRDYFTHTPGHNDRLTTFEAKVVTGVATPPVYQESEICSEELLDGFRRNLGEQLVGADGKIRFVTLKHSGEETVWELERASTEAITPYWIVRVPREVIRNHGDIFNENALAMMARLFRVSNPKSERGIITTPEPRKMYLAEPGAASSGNP